jgi:hypothetical protein
MQKDEDKVAALAEYVAAKRAQEVGVIESCYSRVVSAAQEGHGTRLGPESQDILLSLPRQGPGSGDIHEVSVAKISLSQGLHSDVTSLYEQVQPYQPPAHDSALQRARVNKPSRRSLFEFWCSRARVVDGQ